jgi:hypothetical protein
MHVESVNESQLASSGKIFLRKLRAHAFPEPGGVGYSDVLYAY